MNPSLVVINEDNAVLESLADDWDKGIIHLTSVSDQISSLFAKELLYSTYR